MTILIMEKIGFKRPKIFNKVSEKYKHKSSDNKRAQRTYKQPQKQEAKVQICTKRQQKKNKKIAPRQLQSLQQVRNLVYQDVHIFHKIFHVIHFFASTPSLFLELALVQLLKSWSSFMVGESWPLLYYILFSKVLKLSTTIFKIMQF